MIPALNFNSARAFLAMLDVPGTRFAFRTFADGRRGIGSELTRNLYGTFDEHAKSLQRLNQAGAGIFTTINETDGRGIGTDNIVRVRCAFVDLDGSPVDPVLSYRPPPHVVTETSPGRFHAFWRVDGLALSDFRRSQHTLAERFGGDPSVCDLPRVMRLPGFINRKYDAPHVVRIVRLLARTPVAADALVGTSTSADGGGYDQSGFAAPLDSIITSPGRHNALTSLAATLGARGVCQATIADCLHSFNTHQCSPPLDGERLAEIDKIAGWAARRPVLSPLAEPEP